MQKMTYNDNNNNNKIDKNVYTLFYLLPPPFLLNVFSFKIYQ